MKILNRVQVFAPASIANVGPGFDVLGVAINEPGDIIIAEKLSKPGLKFSLLGKSALSQDAPNVVTHVARVMSAELNLKFGMHLTLYKNMPVSSGLGSSGASSAATAFAINQLLDNPMPRKELIPFATEGEQFASGSGHADNVAPSLLGGICIIRSYDPIDIIQLPHKNIFYWVVVHPHLVINTKTARELMPDNVSLPTVVRQTGNLAALIYGLVEGDEHIISNSMVDHIAEPVRANLILGYDDVRYSALKAGAIAFSISGSGPSVFAITPTRDVATKVGNAMVQGFKHAAGVDCDLYISKVNEQGACVIGGT